jgi:hypothetical protein
MTPLLVSLAALLMIALVVVGLFVLSRPQRRAPPPELVEREAIKLLSALGHRSSASMKHLSRLYIDTVAGVLTGRE